MRLSGFKLKVIWFIVSEIVEAEVSKGLNNNIINGNSEFSKARNKSASYLTESETI